MRTHQQKKYLVILAGLPRGGEKTWKTLIKKVLNHLDADLAVFWNKNWDQNNLLFKFSKYQWFFEEYNDYTKYYKENFDGSWKKYFETGIDSNGRPTGLAESGLIHFVFKDKIKNQYLDTILKYEYVIYSRFNQYYLDYHPKLNSNDILIPSGEDFYGICDRHAAFPSKYAEKFFSICEYINDARALDKVPKFNNCETTFLHHLQDTLLIKNVKRFPRVQFTSSLKGEPTNWRIPKYKIYFSKKIMIKYPDEFITGIKNCIKNYSLRVYLFKEPVLCFNYFLLLVLRKIGSLKEQSEQDFFNNSN